MIAGGLAAEEAIFDLDFHAVMHWGTDPALEKHYVPTRSQRARSVLTFFAQDSGTHNLVYANADLSKATQNREVIAFCDHWKHVTGHDPHLLVMDQKVTTQPCSPNSTPAGSGSSPCGCAHPRSSDRSTRSAPATTRRSPWTGPAPTTGPACTNPPCTCATTPAPCGSSSSPDWAATPPPSSSPTTATPPPAKLITRYARRMTIEQRLAEIIRAFHADALSSAVNLNVDLDIMLCVLAQALLAALRARLPGYAAVTPDILQRRFLKPPARSSPLPTRSPCASTAAPTPPSCARPLSPRRPPSPGGATAPSATSSPNPLASNQLRRLQPGRPASGADQPTANVFGVVSLVFWSVMIIVTLTYVSLVMRASNEGEGGIMALITLLTRWGGDAGSRRRTALLASLGIFGAALFFGDSMITPAISVLSAVEGVKVIEPGLEELSSPSPP